MDSQVIDKQDFECKCKALKLVSDSFLGDNCFLPDNKGFGMVLIKKAWNDITTRLQSVRGFNNKLTLDDLSILFENKLIEVQKREANNKERLELLCEKSCLSVFDAPGSSVTVKCNLGTVVNVDGPSPVAQPVNYQDEMGEESLILVHKRDIVNCLNYGLAHCVYEKFEALANEIEKIDPELPGLYKELLTVYDALHLVDVCDFKEVDEKRLRLLSFVKLTFHGVDNQPTIDSYAVCFPLLVIETLKGFCELFTSHGLPDDIDQAEDVLKATDCLDKEQWCHIVGPVMWRLVFQGVPEADTSELPYFMMDLSTMDSGDFKDFLSTVLLSTPQGEGVVNMLFNHAKRALKYDCFEDDIRRRNEEFEAGTIE